MIHRLAGRITDILLKEGSVNQEDRALCEYGMEQGIWMLINVISVGILGWMMGEILPCVIYLALYIPLRRYAGGYHAANYVRCWAGSGMMVMAVLLGIRYCQVSMRISLAIMSICAAWIVLYSPVETENRPLDCTETVVYRKKARKIICIQAGVAAVAAVMEKEMFVESAMYAYLSMACLMIIEMRRKK